MIMNLKYLMFVFCFQIMGWLFLPDLSYGQEDGDIEYLYSSLLELDQKGEYVKLIESLHKILELNPNEGVAKKVLRSVFVKYLDAISANDDLMNMCFEHLEDLTILPALLALNLTYQRNDFERVDSILNQISRNRFSEVEFDIYQLARLDPSINPELYQNICNTLLTYIPLDSINPSSLILLYNANRLGTLNLDLKVIEFDYYSENSTLLNEILNMDPATDTKNYGTIFQKVINLLPDSILDSVKLDENLYKLGKSFWIIGDTLKANYFFNKIFQNTTDDNRGLLDKLDYITLLEPNIHPGLYLTVASALQSYLQHNKLNPSSLILLYSADRLGSLNLDLKDIELDRYSENSSLLNEIMNMSPARDIQSFGVIFKKLINLISDSILDSVIEEEDLYKLGKSYWIVGDTIKAGYFFNKIFQNITIENKGLLDKLYYGISCVFEHQPYRASRFIEEVYMYGNYSQINFINGELLFWKSKIKDESLVQIIQNNFSGFTDVNNRLPEYIPGIPDQRVIISPDFGLYHALIICIEEYLDPNIQDLRNPISDGKNLGRTLVQSYTFDSANVHYLFNPGRDLIIKTFTKLRRELNEDDNLLVFYAGHGTWDDLIEQGYWQPSDAMIHDISNWISNSDLRDYIKSINTKHTILITDACFGGAIFKERSVDMNEHSAIEDVYNYSSRRAITSGTIQKVPDKSVFLEFLVKRLVENNNKYLLAKNLFFSFREAVIVNSPNQQTPIYGAIYNAGDEGNGDFIFIKR